MALPKIQKELKKYFRDKIDNIGECESIKTNHPEDFKEFCIMFERHPDYPDKFIGFDDIKIDYHPDYKTQLVVYITKNNGDIDDVSVLNSCVTGKPKDKLKIAMRVASYPQSIEFKNKQSQYLCEICGKTDRIEIDHHSETMPFAKLYEKFMEANTIPIPVSFDNTQSHMKCFQAADTIFEESWINYHKQNAILRMLCRVCNGQQPKYKAK